MGNVYIFFLKYLRMEKAYKARNWFFIYILSFFTVATSTAQTDYRNGYIITNENDTIKGQLNYKGSQLYEFVDFKRAPAKPPERLQPQDIKGYGFEEDKIFRSRDHYLTKGEIKKSFLEVLVQGEVSLLKYKKEFYATRQNDSLYHLSNEEKKTYVDGD